MIDIDKKKYPFCFSGYEYAKQVQSGNILSCLNVKNCVNRFFSDISKVEYEEYPFYLDYDKAERFLRVSQKFEHAKGANWKSKNVTFEPWQNFMFMYLMGFMRKSTNRRRFRTAYVQIPRGQGKSLIASQLGLYFLSLDDEEGPEVICASTKKDAARIVFDSSRVMALKNESFLKATGTRVLAHTLVHPSSNGIMKPVASDSKSMDGLNPSLIVGDETHEWNRKLYDVLDSSLTKRDDSLFFMISTAGLSTEGIGHELFSYSEKVLSGDVDDDTWFSIIYSMDKGDDWLDPDVWKKSNPNWGVSVDPINFEAKAKKAQETPASKYNFLVKHLNQWQNTASPFFNVDKWDECADKSLKFEDFYGERCYIGLDLAQKVDLCTIFYIFKKGDLYYLFDKSYLPEERVHDNKNAKFARWVEEGSLFLMSGETINFENLQSEIINDSKKLKINAVHADPWSASDTMQRLSNNRIETLEFRMTTANLSEPMKMLDALIREKKIRHNGSGLLRWCLGNVVAKEDNNSNYFPRKSHSALKIDPIVAAIMALAGYIAEEQNESIYKDRGMVFI